MNIDRLDHLVLTVSDLDATVRFYTRVLGMEQLTFARGAKRCDSAHPRSICISTARNSSRRLIGLRPVAPTCA